MLYLPPQNVYIDIDIIIHVLTILFNNFGFFRFMGETELSHILFIVKSDTYLFCRHLELGCKAFLRFLSNYPKSV